MDDAANCTAGSASEETAAAAAAAAAAASTASTGVAAVRTEREEDRGDPRRSIPSAPTLLFPTEAWGKGACFDGLEANGAEFVRPVRVARGLEVGRAAATQGPHNTRIVINRQMCGDLQGFVLECDGVRSGSDGGRGFAQG